MDGGDRPRRFCRAATRAPKSLIVRLLIAGAALFTLFVSGHEFSQRLSGDLLLDEDPALDAGELAAKGRWAEARLIAEFALSRPDLGDTDEAARILARSNDELESFRGQLQRFAHGAITGEPTDMASMLGSLSLDLFVVGDIRDLVVQGWKEAADGSGDDLILALSAIGLTTTLAPQVDWAPALLKSLKRTGALTREFTQAISRTASRALASGNYRPLTRLVGDFGEAAGRLGPGPLRGVMASVKDVDDLGRIARASAVDPRSTYVVTRLFGKEGIKAIDAGGGNVGKVAGSIKAGSRTAKLVGKYAGALPASWLIALMIVSLLVLLWAMLPGRRLLRSIPAQFRRSRRLAGTNDAGGIQTNQRSRTPSP